jgi:hypothetical protein
MSGPMPAGSPGVMTMRWITLAALDSQSKNHFDKTMFEVYREKIKND